MKGFMKFSFYVIVLGVIIFPSVFPMPTASTSSNYNNNNISYLNETNGGNNSAVNPLRNRDLEPVLMDINNLQRDDNGVNNTNYVNDTTNTNNSVGFNDNSKIVDNDTANNVRNNVNTDNNIGTEDSITNNNNANTDNTNTTTNDNTGATTQTNDTNYLQTTDNTNTWNDTVRSNNQTTTNNTDSSTTIDPVVPDDTQLQEPAPMPRPRPHRPNGDFMPYNNDIDLPSDFTTNNLTGSNVDGISVEDPNITDNTQRQEPNFTPRAVRPAQQNNGFMPFGNVDLSTDLLNDGLNNDNSDDTTVDPSQQDFIKYYKPMFYQLILPNNIATTDEDITTDNTSGRVVGYCFQSFFTIPLYNCDNCEDCEDCEEDPSTATEDGTTESVTTFANNIIDDEAKAEHDRKQQEFNKKHPPLTNEQTGTNASHKKPLVKHIAPENNSANTMRIASIAPIDENVEDTAVQTSANVTSTPRSNYESLFLAIFAVSFTVLFALIISKIKKYYLVSKKSKK